MNTLFYSILTAWVVNSCDGMDVTGLDGWMGHTPSTVMTAGAPAVLKNIQNNRNCLIPSDSPSLRALKWRSLWEDED